LAAGGLDGLMEVRFPLVPGWDVAGVVERVGFDAGEFVVGDEVYGYVRKDWVQQGAYAELVSANVRMLARKPRALDWQQAAGVPLAGLTARRALDRVGVGAGDTVLIHAAAGGVGSLGTQIALARGARVIGTASERNHEYLRSLGAEPVAYGDGLAQRVRALAPDGVDAAVDFVGGDAVDVSLSLLGQPDRLASIADGGVEAKGGHYVWVRPDSAGLAELACLADEGRLAVHVDLAVPLANAAQAWQQSRSGRTRGKIVLTV
jgi:NADPH:quinone reductase-like Zn-dependent oxidoreductase